MVLTERDGELASLRGMLADAQEGRGRLVLLSGPAASGKSAVVRAFAEEVLESGALLLTATGTRAEKALPFGVLSQLVRCVSAVGPAAAGEATRGPASGGWDRDEAVLAAAVAEAREAIHRGGLSTGDLERLCEAFIEVSDQRHMTIVVDDVHYADNISTQFLLYFAQRLKNNRVLLLLTALGRSHNCRAELLGQPHSRVIRIQPLPRAGVSQVVMRRLGEPVARLCTAAFRELSGGNPLLLLGLIDDFPPTARHPVPGVHFAQAVQTLLHRSDPRTLDVARAVAVLDDDSSVTTVHQLLDIDRSGAATSLHALRSAGLLRAGRLRHPSARDAVLDDIPAETRAQLHRRAATLLYEEDAATSTVARHLFAARPVNDPWACVVLVDTARQALRDDDVALAVQCLRTAHFATTDVRERAEIRLRRVQAEWRIDPASAARHLLPLTSSLAAGHLSGSQAVALVRPLVWHGRYAEATTVLQHAALASPVASTGDRAAQESDTADTVGLGVGVEAGAEPQLLRLWLQVTSPPLFRQLSRVLSEPDQAERSLLAVNGTARSTSALLAVLSSGPDDHAVSTAERTLETLQLDDSTVEALGAALAVLIYADRAARAAVLCDGLLGEACDRKVAVWKGVFSGMRSEISYRQGALPAAMRHAKNALTYLSPSAWGVAIGIPLGALLSAASATGRVDEAEQQLRREVPTGMFQTRFGLHYLRARGYHYLATDRPHAALDDFLACGALMGDWGIDLPALVPWRTDAATVHLMMGHDDVARRLVDEQRGRPGTDRGRIAGMTLRLLAATSPGSHRPDLLGAAVDALQDSGDRYELAHALADLSRAQRAAGDHDRARTSSRRARALARECGVETLRRTPFEDAEPVERRVPAAEPTGVVDARLSLAERRVASLAVAGHTNREIAERLQITVSTVEQHLTQVYRKLKVNRRDDLRRIFAPAAGAAALTT